MKTKYRLASVAFSLSAPLALLLSTSSELRADNNAYDFQAQYTALNCGAPLEFTCRPPTTAFDSVLGSGTGK